jgi:hypothetical protein
LVRVTNRVGDDYDSRERGSSRHFRDVRASRDERRLFDDLNEPLVDQPFCGSVGVFIPNGGGTVMLDNPHSRRRQVLHFSPSGQLASAHF